MNCNEMRRRDLLCVCHIEAFATFCAENGDWSRVAPKGKYEVLRMRRTLAAHEIEWLIVHKRTFNLSGEANVQHCTTWGQSTVWAQKFYHERKKNAQVTK